MCSFDTQTCRWVGGSSRRSVYTIISLWVSRPRKTSFACPPTLTTIKNNRNHPTGKATFHTGPPIKVQHPVNLAGTGRHSSGQSETALLRPASLNHVYRPTRPGYVPCTAIAPASLTTPSVTVQELNKSPSPSASPSPTPAPTSTQHAHKKGSSATEAAPETFLEPEALASLTKWCRPGINVSTTPSKE